MFHAAISFTPHVTPRGRISDARRLSAELMTGARQHASALFLPHESATTALILLKTGPDAFKSSLQSGQAASGHIHYSAGPPYRRRREPLSDELTASPGYFVIRRDDGHDDDIAMSYRRHPNCQMANIARLISA